MRVVKNRAGNSAAARRVRLAISRIIEWLPQRKGAQDDLRLPKDAKPVV